MTITLRTVEEARAYLERPVGERTDGGIAFAGELARIEVLINGPRYKATIPGELARGLWEMQEALYKAAAFALIGAEDIRRLTAAQRQQLELVF